MKIKRTIIYIDEIDIVHTLTDRVRVAANEERFPQARAIWNARTPKHNKSLGTGNSARAITFPHQGHQYVGWGLVYLRRSYSEDPYFPLPFSSRDHRGSCRRLCMTLADLGA